jgi:tetratricopeptide (TPR) repeat protein
MAAERGIIGLGLFAWFLAAVLVPLIRRIADPPDDLGAPVLPEETVSVAAGCVLLAWLTDGLVNGPLNLPPSSYLFWLFAVLACRPEGLDEDIDDGRQPGGAKQGLATASSAGGGDRPGAIPAFGAVLLSALVLLFLLRPFARDLASEGYLLAGNRALERGDAPLALPYCLRAWALSYEDRRHNFYLGEAYYNQGQYREAEEEFARDVMTNPSYHSGWHNLGLARYALGASGPALDAFVRALAINPADGDTLGMIMKLKTGAKPAIDRAKTTR